MGWRDKSADIERAGQRDRADLMRTAAAHLEPLLLTYRSDGRRTGTTAVIERTSSATRGAPSS